MAWEKDIRFPEKKIDDSWKDQIGREAQSNTASRADKGSNREQEKSKNLPSSKPFINLISSLGFQALMHLGEIATPEQSVPEINLQAAREIIELLSALKTKTEDRRSPEESELIVSLLSELQLKFSQKV